MFLKQSNRRLQQLLAVENKTILQQPKPSTFYIMYHLTLIFYPHHTGMRSQMLYTNGSFEICQERMFVNHRRTHSWSTYLLSKQIFMLKQKSSNLYMICFNSVNKFLSNYLCTLHWHVFTNASHKRGHLKSAKSECFWTSVEHTAEALACCRKKYLCSSKNRQISTW